MEGEVEAQVVVATCHCAYTHVSENVGRICWKTYRKRKERAGGQRYVKCRPPRLSMLVDVATCSHPALSGRVCYLQLFTLSSSWSPFNCQ